MRVENRGSSIFKFPCAPCPLHKTRGFVFYIKLCGVWPCESLLEGPRILIVPQCPDEMCLFIVLTAWSWHGQHQSLPAGVLTWLHLLKLSTCCNSGEVGNQKQCYLCTSLACPILQKMPTLTPSARERDLSINMKHPLNRYQIQPMVITLWSIQWGPMALFPND